MDVEGKIAELLELAAPLRELADDDPAKAPLAGIVDEINRLRAVQEKQGREAPVEHVLAPLDAQPAGNGAPLADAHRFYAGPSAATEEGADAAPVKQRRKPGPKPKKGEQQ